MTNGFIVYEYLYEMSRIGKSRGTESRLVVVRGWGRQGIGNDCAGYRFLFEGMGMFWNLIVVMLVQDYECAENHCIIHFKVAN